VRRVSRYARDQGRNGSLTGARHHVSRRAHAPTAFARAPSEAASNRRVDPVRTASLAPLLAGPAPFDSAQGALSKPKGEARAVDISQGRRADRQNVLHS
jgi:hypothetical protein